MNHPYKTRSNELVNPAITSEPAIMSELPVEAQTGSASAADMPAAPVTSAPSPDCADRTDVGGPLSPPPPLEVVPSMATASNDPESVQPGSAPDQSNPFLHRSPTPDAPTPSATEQYAPATDAAASTTPSAAVAHVPAATVAAGTATLPHTSESSTPMETTPVNSSPTNAEKSSTSTIAPISVSSQSQTMGLEATPRAQPATESQVSGVPPVLNPIGVPAQVAVKRPAEEPLSPRKSKRTRLPTPKARDSPLFKPTPPPPPTPQLKHRDIIMTPQQALTKNNKLPAGYRLVPIGFFASDGTLNPPSAAALNGSAPRKRTKVDLDAHFLETPSPAAKTPSVRTSGRKPKHKVIKYQSAEEAAAEEKRERIAILQKRLELLKARQQEVLGVAPSPVAPVNTPAASSGRKGAKKKSFDVPKTPSTPAYASHASNPPPPSAYNTPVPSPPVPRHQSPHTPSFSSTPLTPGDGRSSRSGREIKAPKFLTADDNVPVKLTEPLRRCRDLLTTLMTQKFSYFYNEPVDPVKLNIPDYFTIIKQPMDLGTIKANLNMGAYLHVDDYARDVRQVWYNATIYNKQGTIVHEMAKEYSALFERKFLKIPKVAASRHTTPRARARKESLSETKKKEKQSPAPTGLEKQLLQMQKTMEMMSKKFETMAGRGGGGGSAGSARKNLDKTALTHREKQKLKQDIFKLPSGKLGPVVEMCSRNMGVDQQNDDEIEIDIDKLDIPTLRELQRYVKRALGAQSRGRTGKTPTPQRSPAVTPGRQSQSQGMSPHDQYTPNNQAPDTLNMGLEIPSPFQQLPQQQNLAHPLAQAKPAESDSDSDSDSSSGSSSSDSDSDDDSSMQKTQVPLSAVPSFSSAPINAPPPSFGDPSAGMYSTAPMVSSAPQQMAPSIAPNPVSLDLDKDLPDTTEAWGDLGSGTTNGNHWSNNSGDGLWSSFQSKEQEQRHKERERQQREAELAAEQQRKAEELKRQADEIRMQQEREAARQQREREQAVLEADRQREAEREAAKRARETADTVDLGEQSMMMEMMDQFS